MAATVTPALGTKARAAWRAQLSDPTYIAEHAFDVARRLAALVNSHGDAPDVHELVLRACEHRDAFGPSGGILDAVVRAQGLFPYLSAERLGFADRVAYEMHRPDDLDAETVFHSVQARVYELLLEGDNVVLSAPTSFGKSLIIDAVIAARDFRNVAVVVPTIALIDETRRRLISRFRDMYKVITHAGQRPAERNIYVLTPERVPEMSELAKVEFFAIDEFYKLDPRRDPERSPSLNEALYRLSASGAQFYLLGPNIDNIPAAFTEGFRCRFIRTDFATVVSETVRMKLPRRDRLDVLVRLCREELSGESTLIYCASPESARTVVSGLLAAAVGRQRAELAPAVAWAAEHFHAEWGFVRALAQGIGLHHGKMPRSLAQFVVRAFNGGLLDHLVCTSTLIEGVNTKAKNVVVYDNTLAQRKLDYFTFNNIKGRSGRMARHFVGRVFLFADPPREEYLDVDIPLVTQTGTAADSLLIQLDNEDLSESARERLRPLFEQAVLPVPVIRANRGVDPLAQVRLAQALADDPDAVWPALSWTRSPTSAQLRTVCRLIWDYLVMDRARQHGVSSAAQLAFKLERFRAAPDVARLIQAELDTQRGESDPDAAVEDTLDFLRYWASYHFPRYLMALSRIQHVIFVDADLPPGEYSVFASQVEHLFAPAGIAALDEYGVPLQVGLKLADELGTAEDLDTALERLRRLDASRTGLSEFERELVEEAQRYV